MATRTSRAGDTTDLFIVPLLFFAAGFCKGGWLWAVMVVLMTAESDPHI